MKKSTVLILFIVFVGSVLVVGLFGMRSVPVEQRIPIEEIYFTSIDTNLKNEKYQGNLIDRMTTNQDGQNEIYLPFEEGMTVFVGYAFNPADATDKSVDINILYPNDYDPDDPDNYFTVDDRFVITFKGCCTIRLQYQSADQGADRAVTDLWINVIPEEYL